MLIVSHDCPTGVTPCFWAQGECSNKVICQLIPVSPSWREFCIMSLNISHSLWQRMMMHSISSAPFICNIYIQRRLAAQIVVILITCLLEKVCFKACFKFLCHMYCEVWQVENSRGAEQLTRKHGHHTSSGVYLGHGDSVYIPNNSPNFHMVSSVLTYVNLLHIYQYALHKVPHKAWVWVLFI